MKDATRLALRWFKARIHDGTLTLPHETIYWHLRVQDASIDLYAGRVGAQVLHVQQIIVRMIIKSNGVRLPMYGQACDLLFPQDIENALIDYATSLKIRRQRQNDGA
jgi:hypothetical protein